MKKGLLNIYKPVGLTSHDVVAKLRRITGIKQIGHTGTLDPFAEGVLPICIGKATRLIEYFCDEKEYLATVQFGKSTTTYDIEGEITSSSDLKVTREQIYNALKNFEGEIEQFPPIYSAIKVKGKKLYEYARNGIDVKIEPRKVTIEKIELQDFDAALQQAQVLIKCSKGTYIRSIAHDLGKLLGCGAHLIKLIRTQAGNFRVETSVQLEGIDVEKNLINPIAMIDLPQLSISDEEFRKISNGMPIKNRDLKNEQIAILVYNNDEICAVGIADGELIKIKKVLI